MKTQYKEDHHMTTAQITMLGLGIFYAIAFIGLTVLEVHLIRILISLRPENCEKCTGFFSRKGVEPISLTEANLRIFNRALPYKAIALPRQIANKSIENLLSVRCKQFSRINQ